MPDKPKRKNIVMFVLKAVDNEILDRWSKRPMRLNDPLEPAASFALSLRKLEKIESSLVNRLHEVALSKDNAIAALFDDSTGDAP